VRQAIYQAINEDTIGDQVMHGLAIPRGMIIQPGINGYAPELDTRLPFDPRQRLARRRRLPERLRGDARLPERPLHQR
jgi:ABC-type oligopeptide transport system substrate-binding subunit